MKRLLICILAVGVLFPTCVFADLEAELVGPIPGRYVVTLADTAVRVAAGHRDAPAEVRTLANDLAFAYEGRVERTWGHAVNGFVMENLSEDAAKRLSRHPFVRSVQPDLKWRFVSAASNCYGAGPFPSDTRTLPSSLPNSSQTITCTDPTNSACIDNWGIDRIDQRNLPRNAQYAWGDNGYAVHLYIIDTGIDNHREFRDHLGLSRLDRTFGADFTTDGNTYDCYGHGTHVAGIAAGRTYGVAKDAIVHPVKFGSCTGFQDSWLISSVDFVRQNVTQRGWPAVANLSGGNTTSLTQNVAFQTAVTNLINSGVQFVQAAGNQNRDACSWSLGNTTNALVVGGTMHTDSRWTGNPGSNYGPCVDLFAPAALINSAKFVASGNGSGYNAEYCELTGTSMAAPHVTGALAIYLDANPSLTPAQLRSLVINDATNGVLSNLGAGSPNKLLYIP